MSLEISVLGYMHVYDEDTRSRAESQVRKQGNIGHPQGYDLVEEGESSDGEPYYTFDVYSHVTVKDYEDKEDAKVQALEETGFDRSSVEVNEYDVTEIND